MLPQAVRTFLATGPLGHVVTLDQDGSAQVSLAWVGVEGDTLVIGTLPDQAKLRNLRRDPRVVVSFESPAQNAWGLNEYLVVHGRADVTAGGAAALLQRLAHVYLGPDVVFPGTTDAAAGWVIRITPERITGIGPWRDQPGG